MWYIGIANVTTNSVEVIGDANVDFVNNVEPGDAFICTGNGLTLEVLRAESRNKLVLARPYTGPTGSFAFSIQPTQDYNRVTANAIIDLKNSYGVYRDTALQGAFPDGSAATPGLRFIADQDTGWRRYAENMLSVVAGGVDQVFFGTNGVGINFSNPRSPLDVVGQITIRGAGSNTGARDLSGIGYGTATYTSGPIIVFRVEGGTNLDDNVCTIFRKQANGVASEAMRIDAAGNLLVGTSAQPCHTIARGEGDGVQVLNVSGLTAGSAAFFSGGGAPSSGAACAIKVATSAVTLRSINAGGTGNFSGSDYAEYMLKADGCGIIAKGDVCGVDRDGKLTKAWADAISFVVKSTDPSLVGGDTWAKTPRPEQNNDESEADFSARMTAWEIAHQAERAVVDRIAFSGQVPCNVTGNFDVGDYIVAAANGAGIKAVAMKLDDMTLAQYARRIGKVWAIRDGRAWVDVQHG